jgi:hypothetical protein
MSALMSRGDTRIAGGVRQRLDYRAGDNLGNMAYESALGYPGLSRLVGANVAARIHPKPGATAHPDVHAHAARRRFHVVGVPAKGVDTPAGIVGVRTWGAPASQFRQVRDNDAAIDDRGHS